MLRRLGRLALAASALWLGGCLEDPSTAPTEASAGASGSAAAALAGASALQPQPVAGGGGGGTGGGAVMPQAGGSSSSAGGALSCSSYTDDPTWKIQIHIENQRSETLYLGQTTMDCDVKRMFQVEDGARRLLPSLDNCHSSCETMMQTGPTACPNICAMPSTITLEPGQSLDLPWDGRFGVEHMLPQQCMRGTMTSTSTCIRAEHVVAGPYTFSAQAGTKRQCLGAGGVCSCIANPNGAGCTSPGSTITGTLYTTEMFLALEPGELSPSGQPPYIELLFKN